MDVLAHVAPGNEAELTSALARAEIVTTPDRREANVLLWTVHGEYAALREHLGAMPNLRLLQLPAAGIEDFIDAGCLERPDLTYASCRGAFAVPVAEHAVALTLALLRQLHVRARARTWGEQAGTMLHGLRVVIIGRGGVGQQTGRLVEAFGAQATYLGREACAPTTAGATGRSEAFVAAMRGADVVVLCCPLTNETRGLIGAAELGLLPPTAHLVNVARGAIVDTDALVAALHEHRLAGAALDVTDPEPLPDHHPLWHLENCLITPHTADTRDMVVPLIAERAVGNAIRFGTGQPLVGLVDPERGY